MKKILSFLLSLCMLLALLAGCGTDNAAAAPDEADDPTQFAPAPDTAVVESTDSADFSELGGDTGDATQIAFYGSKAYTTAEIAEICNTYRGLEHRLTNEKYDIYRTDNSWWLNIGGRDYYWYQVYPETEWTPEEVATYFREHSYAWGNPKENYYEAKAFYLWTQDYTTRFKADLEENWLYANDLRIAPLFEDVYSMDPKALVESYQRGEWGGFTSAWSADFGTSVVVNEQSGALEYTFDVEYPSEASDPDCIAWRDYADAPWWDTTDYGVTIYASPSHSCQYSGTLHQRSEISAAAYVDVPWEQQHRLWATRDFGTTPSREYTLYAARNEDGLHGLVDTGAELWRDGFLRQSWSFKVTPDAHIVNIDDGFFVYSNHRLLELHDDGTYDVVLRDIVSVNNEHCYYGSSTCPCFTIVDGTLYFNFLRKPPSSSSSYIEQRLYHRDFTIQSSVLAEHVVAADLANEDLVLYTDNTGKTYAVYDFLGSDAGINVLALEGYDYKISCLGEGSIKHFQTLCEQYLEERLDENDGNEYRTYAAFITETVNAYAAETGEAIEATDTVEASEAVSGPRYQYEYAPPEVI